MSTYRNTPDWCMSHPVPVNMNSVGVCSADKMYRCPNCKKRVKMARKPSNPASLGNEYTWFWPAHKIRKTKR